MDNDPIPNTYSVSIVSSYWLGRRTAVPTVGSGDVLLAFRAKASSSSGLVYRLLTSSYPDITFITARHTMEREAKAERLETDQRARSMMPPQKTMMTDIPTE